MPPLTRVAPRLQLWLLSVLILSTCWTLLVVGTSITSDQALSQDYRPWKERPTYFWETLMLNPFGKDTPRPQVPPGCQLGQLGDVCTAGEDCCDAGCSDNFECCKLFQAECAAATECCTGGCSGSPSTCCKTAEASCDPTSATPECCNGSSCVSSQCCKDNGEECGAVSECCDGGCSGSPPTCCKTAQASCLATSECCDGSVCSNSQCCKTLGVGCSAAGECCDGGCSSGATCCVPNSMGSNTCNANSDCCGNYCDIGGGGTSGSPNDRQCKVPCFAASTLVRTLEHEKPIALADLKIGDHVECMDTSGDMRLPTTPKYCEVMNWLHANPDATPLFQRITFNRPGGVQGSLTVSTTHFVTRLTSPGVREGSTAAKVHGFGRFESVAARAVKEGDRLALTAHEDATGGTRRSQGGFVAVAVTKTETIEAKGFYTPALESPYMIADGVVTPLYTSDFDAALVIPDGQVDGAHIAALHYQHAPAFMQRFHPVGITGKDALTKGAAFGTEEGQGLDPIWAAGRPHLQAGKTISYAALRDWFLPRYQAWKDGRGGAVTVAEVAATMGSEATWVKVASKPGDVDRSIAWERGAT